MKLLELLYEKKVESTWISDLSYNRPKRILTMSLSNGKSFTIPGISRTMFERWSMSPSKGKYFHQNVKGKYNIQRIR